MQAEAQLTSNGKRVLGSTPGWDPCAVKAFIGVSGAYDVHALADHLDRRPALAFAVATFFIWDRPAVQPVLPAFVALHPPRVA